MLLLTIVAGLLVGAMMVAPVVVAFATPPRPHKTELAAVECPEPEAAA